ncbi:DUF6907 domain-containing protein [Streptomyces sp. NPDC093221]|uniref:DUF6907 domain-containing protein n=1 Tax=Streptomyces sp. NPDC093221 TaxID=3366032 RepID=UPI0037FDB78F
MTEIPVRGRTGLVSARLADGLPVAGSESLSGRGTWTIGTTMGFVVEGYLPEWAEEDPSREGVPPELLPARLADVGHWVQFEGQPMRVHNPAADGEMVGNGQVFSGGIDCHPFAEYPESRVPVVNLAVVGDIWINGLDPNGLTEIAAQLRAQADRLDREVRPRLVAARADWAEQHGVRMIPASGASTEVVPTASLVKAGPNSG